MEEDINGFEINQKGKDYILLIDLQENNILIKCINKSSGDFFFSKQYDLSYFNSMNKYFQIYNNIQEIQSLLNNAIEKAKIGLLEDFNQLTIFFYLIFDTEENTIAFSLNKESDKNRNSEIKELNSLKDINDDNNNSKYIIDKLEKDYDIINKKNIILIEQMQKLNIELTQLKNELATLNEKSDIFKAENEKLMEYKFKYEEIIQSSFKNNFLHKNELKISSVINKFFLGKNNINNNINENINGKENLHLNEKNNEEKNNMNIIDNDNFENEIDNDIENKKLNKIDTIKEQKEIYQKILENKINNEEEKINNQDNIANVYENINNIINKSNKLKEDLVKNEENKNKNKNEKVLDNKKNESNNKDDEKTEDIDEDSELEIEFIRNNKIVNTSNKKFDKIQENIEKTINSKEDIDNNNNNFNGNENIIKDKSQDFNEKEEKQKINENMIQKINEDKETMLKNIRDSINRVEIKNQEIKNEENININGIPKLLNIDIKENKNINDNNEINKDNINNGNINTENNIIKKNEKYENINNYINKIADDDENKMNKNIDKTEETKEKIEIKNQDEKPKENLKEKELINQIEKINKYNINKSEKTEKNNIEIKKDESTAKNIKYYIIKNDEIINKEKERLDDKKINSNINNTEINTKVNIEKLKSNNINYELDLSNSFITKNDDISEASNYFYNDQVNDTYKPTDFKKKANNKQIQNKISNFNLETKDKDQNINHKKDNNKLKSDIIQNISELYFISNRIHKNKYKINVNLLYKASIDGDKASIFHEKCNKAQTTLILIQTKNNKKFGGFTKRTWRGKNIEKTDNDAFIFSFDNKKIYNVIKGKNAIGCFIDYNTCFSGAFKIYDNAFDKGGILIKNENNYEIKDISELINNNESENNIEENNNINFNIKEIEVYEIKIA